MDVRPYSKMWKHRKTHIWNLFWHILYKKPLEDPLLHNLQGFNLNQKYFKGLLSVCQVAVVTLVTWVFVVHPTLYYAAGFTESYFQSTVIKRLHQCMPKRKILEILYISTCSWCLKQHNYKMNITQQRFHPKSYSIKPCILRNPSIHHPSCQRQSQLFYFSNYNKYPMFRVQHVGNANFRFFLHINIPSTHSSSPHTHSCWKCRTTNCKAVFPYAICSLKNISHISYISPSELSTKNSLQK